MTFGTHALANLPSSLRTQLLTEYETIVQHFLERRWSPSELGAGRFCEVVYCIVDGYGKKAYPNKATKPQNMVAACRALENVSTVPRSFQILIPRMLPCLYEVRNNRGAGHVGGDVDPNQMDSTAVLSMANWIMAELVRVLHATSTEEAQSIVDSLTQRRIPLIWDEAGLKRVLDPNLQLKEQVLLLLASSSKNLLVDKLFIWTGYENRSYFMRLLRALHKQRLLELSSDEVVVNALPTATKLVEVILRDHEKRQNTATKSSRTKRLRS